MKPTLKRRFIKWICRVFGHRSEFSHIYAGNRHYICKRCGSIESVPLSRQNKGYIRTSREELEEEEEKMK